MATVVQQRTVAPELAAVSGMADHDYVDVFTAPTSGASGRSPERWARAVVERSPTARRFAPFVWRVVLRLRLAPAGAPGTVGGWRIAGRGPDWLRLEAASWAMTAHVVVRVDDRQVAVALFVGYDHPVAARLWPPLAVVHRRAMPVLLREALAIEVAS